MTTGTFKNRLQSGEPLIGTWVKTPSAINSEVLGMTPLDCVSLDAEHAPFDREAIDLSMLALRAQNMPALVRIPSLSEEHALSALDCGASGVIAPHVRSADDAQRFARMCHYGAGGRGYAGSSRAANYTGKPMSEHLAASRAETATIAMIEDPEALDNLDAIAKVEDLDCLFVGRIDLTVALGAQGPSDPQVLDAVQTVCRIGAEAGRRVGMFLGDITEIPRWIEAGASLFILKSDHSFLLEGARRLRDEFDQMAGDSTR